MLPVLRRLNNKLMRHRPRAATSAEVSALPAKRGEQGARWSAAEAALLLDYERRKAPVTASLGQPDQVYRTLVLGVDLIDNQLLLDRLFPAPPVHQLAGDQPFWLNFDLNEGCYRVCVQTREFLCGQQLVADILLSRYLARSDRGKPVTYRNAGPRTQLQLRSGRVLHGHLKAVSLESALVVLNSLDAEALQQPQERIKCQIAFNDRFQLQCTGRAQQSAYPAPAPSVRAGQRSHLVRLTLTHMDASHMAQLQSYLRACQTPNSQAA